MLIGLATHGFSFKYWYPSFYFQVFSIIRSQENPQIFHLEYVKGQIRKYSSTDRYVCMYLMDFTLLDSRHFFELSRFMMADPRSVDRRSVNFGVNRIWIWIGGNHMCCRSVYRSTKTLIKICISSAYIIKIQNKQRRQLTNTSSKQLAGGAIYPIAWLYNQNGDSQSKRKFLCWF